MSNGISRRDVLRLGAVAAATPAALAVSRLAASAEGAEGAVATSGADGASVAPGHRWIADRWAVKPFALDQVRLGDGVFGQKQARMLNFARNYPGTGGVLDGPNRMLVNFRNLAGLDTLGFPTPGGWESANQLLRGHYTGHYMTLLSQSHAATGETVFVDKLSYLVTELGRCQDALAARIGQEPPEPGWFVPSHPGYLSAFHESQFIILEDPSTTFNHPQVWACWYTMHKLMRGLLDAYELVHLDRALDIVLKMGDWAHSRLAGLTVADRNRMWNIYSAGETGGANEVIAELAAHTEDPERKANYVEAARAFDFPNLFNALRNNQDVLNGRHANTFVPPETGHLRIFELTGDDDYFTVARNFWGMVVPDRIYSNGGTSGPGEFFRVRGRIAGYLRGNPGSFQTFNETCTAYNMLKLTRNLFFHDPDPQYMDYYEKGLYNQILGSRRDVDSNTGPWVTYHQQLFPGASRRRDYARYGQNGSCCNGTGLENHTKYQESIYSSSADESGLYVNLYIASRLDWSERGFSLVQDTDMPTTGSSTLTIAEGSGPLEIKLRVPGWMRKGFAVTVNGEQQAIAATPSTYVSISRHWSPGDEIRIAMPLSFRVERAPDDPTVQSIFYGPSLIVGLGPSAPPTNQEAARQAWRQLTLYRHVKRDSDFSQAFAPAGAPMHFSSHGFTFRPFYIADPEPVPLRYHAYFERVEPEVVFGSLETGVPNDAIRDDAGLTFLDRVWDEAPFATHGGFVSTVARTSEAFLEAGLFTAAQKEAVDSTAARARLELEP